MFSRRELRAEEVDLRRLPELPKIVDDAYHQFYRNLFHVFLDYARLSSVSHEAVAQDLLLPLSAIDCFNEKHPASRSSLVNEVTKDVSRALSNYDCSFPVEAVSSFSALSGADDRAIKNLNDLFGVMKHTLRLDDSVIPASTIIPSQYSAYLVDYYRTGSEKYVMKENKFDDSQKVGTEFDQK
jgi:hypothetical protein